MSTREEPIHLVLGISSAGKSTYIKSQIRSARWSGLPILMAHELESTTTVPDRTCVVHYNLLRPLRDTTTVNRTFTSDGVLSRLLKESSRLEAELLIVPKSVLTQRILFRAQVEPDLRPTAGAEYPRAEMLDKLRRLDVTAFYRRWIELLASHRVRYRLIDSSNGGYRSIPSRKLVPALVSHSVSRRRTSNVTAAGE